MIDLGKLRPGEAVAYATTASLAKLRVEDPGDPKLEAADAAWREALAGRVSLVQRRTDKGFEYLAVGRHRVDRTPVLPAVPQGVRPA